MERLTRYSGTRLYSFRRIPIYRVPHSHIAKVTLHPHPEVGKDVTLILTMIFDLAPRQSGFCDVDWVACYRCIRLDAFSPRARCILLQDALTRVSVFARPVSVA